MKTSAENFTQHAYICKALNKILSDYSGSLILYHNNSKDWPEQTV